MPRYPTAPLEKSICDQVSYDLYGALRRLGVSVVAMGGAGPTVFKAPHDWAAGDYESPCGCYWAAVRGSFIQVVSINRNEYDIQGASRQYSLLWHQRRRKKKAGRRWSA
jgi:hypothetical protein